MKPMMVAGGLIMIALFALPSSVSAAAIRSLPIQIHNGAEAPTKVEIPSANAAGGLSLAVADLGADGIPEFIYGNGLGLEPYVIIRRQNGSEIGRFLAFSKEMRAGLNVVACDLNNDGGNEIVVAPQRGGGPHLRIFDRFGHLLPAGNFFAYNNFFFGGVNLACGNLDDDPAAELITLPGFGGGPHVKIWKLSDGQPVLHQEFFSSTPEDTRGLVGTVASGRLTIASQHASQTTVRTYVPKHALSPVEEKNIELPARGVAAVAVHNSEILLATTSDDLLYNLSTGEEKILESPFGSLQAISANLDQDTEAELIVVPSRPLFSDDQGEKNILIDLSEQRLYAFENGVLTNTFLVSTAKPGWKTPLGNTQILAKIPSVHYFWNYGPNDPRNYDLGHVPYNLRIFPHIYIHSAYWHNNFGYPVSHGCVNAQIENARWIYAWADEGTPVEVRE